MHYLNIFGSGFENSLPNSGLPSGADGVVVLAHKVIFHAKFPPHPLPPTKNYVHRRNMKKDTDGVVVLAQGVIFHAKFPPLMKMVKQKKTIYIEET